MGAGAGKDGDKLANALLLRLLALDYILSLSSKQRLTALF